MVTLLSFMVAAVLGGAAGPLTAQEAPRDAAVSSGQVVSVLGAGAAFGVSVLMDANTGLPECAPCDPLNVPAFDRWMIRPTVASYSTASDVLVLGLAAGTLGHTAGSEAGVRGVLVGLETVAWSIGVTELSKAIVGRKRPVLYTDDAPEAAGDVTNQRAMPSGHTATAFALATAYWLNNSDVQLSTKILAVAGAVGVGVLRVAAAKHFPSDVVIGAAVGAATGFVLHRLRF
jgi:membrane-associated phospholipid phosphatase